MGGNTGPNLGKNMVDGFGQAGAVMGGGMGLGQLGLNHDNGNRRAGGDGMMGNQDHDRSQSNFGAGPIGMSNYGQQQQQRPDFDNRGRNGDGRRDNQNWGRQGDGGNNGRREDENRRGDRRWDGDRGGRVNDQSSNDWNNQRGSGARQGGSGFEGGASFRLASPLIMNSQIGSMIFNLVWKQLSFCLTSSS